MRDWLSPQQEETLAEDLDLFMHDLCVGWGWCNWTVSGESLLREGEGRVTAEAIARAVIEAEGYGVQDYRFQFVSIQRLFRYRYEAASISEDTYRPGKTPPYRRDPPSGAYEPPHPILWLARELLNAAERLEPGATLDPPPELSGLDGEAVMAALRRVRSRGYFTVGETDHRSEGRDMRALILLHEVVTKQFWASDAETRLKLGLGPRPGQVTPLGED